MWSQADARFVGRVKDDGFRLSYVSGGQNTYAPWIRGSVRPLDGGSIVDVRMSLHPIPAMLVLSFMAFPIWLSRHNLTNVLIWLLVTLGFHVVMYYIGFRSEALTAEDLLREVATLQSLPASEARRT